jgi:hypothetical protein
MTEYADHPMQFYNAAELRQTSDLFMQRLDRLHRLESRKREVPPAEVEFLRLAREIEDLARALLESGSHQVELAEEVHDQAMRDDFALDQPIRDTPPLRDPVAILAEWRAAERRLSPAAIGLKEDPVARADVERLRGEYRRRTNPTASADEGSGAPRA